MKIAIVGAGSIGLLLASYLSQAFSVVLYTRSDEQAKEINQNGLILIKGNEKTKVTVKAAPSSKWTGMEELSIITVKQYQLSSILNKLNKFGSIPKNLLFLQNGMGHLNQLKKIKTPNIFVGSVEHGALKENAYTVSHNGEGLINVAVFKGVPGTLFQFVNKSPSQFLLTYRENYYEMLINKLIANAIINPLTAILQVKNGELINNPFYLFSLKKLFGEISLILNLEDTEKKLSDIIEICKKTSENRSSMLKDIEAGRPTEVDAILGFLLDEAKIQDKQALQIESYYYLLKGKELDWRKGK